MHNVQYTHPIATQEKKIGQYDARKQGLASSHDLRTVAIHCERSLKWCSHLAPLSWNADKNILNMYMHSYGGCNVTHLLEG